MTVRLDIVVTRVPGVAIEEVRDWVARGWVLPQGGPPDWAFAEIDVARVRLIRDLRHDLGVEEETLPLVLSLLDQVYELRRRLRALAAAAGDERPPLGGL
jgi:chaperone modulatory protein CbpM